MKEFKQCFNATEVLRPKCDMNAYPIDQIVPRDLVMIEFYIICCKVKKDGHSKKPPTWTEWCTQFELHSVNLFGKSNYKEMEVASDVYV